MASFSHATLLLNSSVSRDKVYASGQHDSLSVAERGRARTVSRLIAFLNGREGGVYACVFCLYARGEGRRALFVYGRVNHWWGADEFGW